MGKLIESTFVTVRGTLARRETRAALVLRTWSLW
jgi:hypothetical protein